MCVTKGWLPPAIRCARVFDLNPGDRVYSIRGMRVLDDRPLCYFVINLPAEFAPFFEGEKLESGAILSVVEKKSGLVVEKVRQTISASRVRKHVAKYLELDEGDPVLVFERIYYAAGDRVVEAGTSYFQPDHYHYIMEFSHEK